LSCELPVIEGVCVYGGGMSHWFDWSQYDSTVGKRVVTRVVDVYIILVNVYAYRSKTVL